MDVFPFLLLYCFLNPKSYIKHKATTIQRWWWWCWWKLIHDKTLVLPFLIFPCWRAFQLYSFSRLMRYCQYICQSNYPCFILSSLFIFHPFLCFLRTLIHGPHCSLQYSFCVGIKNCIYNWHSTEWNFNLALKSHRVFWSIHFVVDLVVDSFKGN